MDFSGHCEISFISHLSATKQCDALPPRVLLSVQLGAKGYGPEACEVLCWHRLHPVLTALKLLAVNWVHCAAYTLVGAMVQLPGPKQQQQQQQHARLAAAAGQGSGC